MFRPYVVRGGDGQFHLLVHSVRRGRGREDLRPTLLVSSGADGITWSPARVLGLGDGYVANSYAAAAVDGLLVYADYYADEGGRPKLARFYRASKGTWWRGRERLSVMPGWAGSTCRTAGGRLLLATSDDQANVWCVECTGPAKEIERAKAKTVQLDTLPR